MERRICEAPRRAGSARWLLCLPLAALLAQLAPVALWAQGPSGGVISGRVTGARGMPERVMVRLLSEGDIPAAEMYTDSNGLFAFRALPNGTYWVDVQAEGYRPVRQSVWLDMRITPRVQVNIALEPVVKEVPSAGPSIPGSIRSRELNAKNPTGSFDSKAVREYDKGNKDQQEGNLAGAVSHYQRALQIAPDFYPALNNLGAIYLRQKDVARAKEAFLRLLYLNPDDAEPYINLGHVLYQEGKYPEAIERLEEGVKRSPRSSLGHFFLGSACMKLGQLEKAEPNLKKAYSLDPAGMAPARLQLANLYLKRHDLQAASVELEGYLQTNPSDPQAPAIKKMLASIKAH